MNTTITRSGMRSRWAAIGAAVAVSLGAGGIGLVSATSPDGAVAYVPVEPCRLADTRAGEFNIGPRNTPISADETLGIQATGDNGDCTGIPATATGLQLNVTAVGATAPTFLTIWGSGDQPDASHLNPVPGQPPTPNAVTTGLTAGGAINVYNLAGTVEIIVDVLGFYTDHDHDDRYYTESEVDAALDGKADVGDSYTKSESDGKYLAISQNTEGAFETLNNTGINLTPTDVIVATATVDTPTSGYVMADATVRFLGGAAEGQGRCSLTTGTALNFDSVNIVTVPTDEWATLPLTQGFSENKAILVLGGDDNEMTVNIVCDDPESEVSTGDVNLTLTFVDDPDAFGLAFITTLSEPNGAPSATEGAP